MTLNLGIKIRKRLFIQTYVKQLRWTHWALWEDISACFSSFEFLLIRYNKFRKIDCHDQLVLLLLFIVSTLKYQLRQG